MSAFIPQITEQPCSQLWNPWPAVGPARVKQSGKAAEVKAEVEPTAD
jgi:hypothetical protein